MTASIGVDLETFGRGGLASAGLQSAGLQSGRFRLGQLPGTHPSEAGARGAISASPLNAAQIKSATGWHDSGSAAANPESFQSRWQATLADLGAGSAKADGEAVQDASAAPATETGTEAGSAAGSAAGVWNHSMAGVDQAARGTQIEVTSRGRNVLPTAEGSATAPATVLNAVQIEPPTDAKPHLGEMARTSSSQGNAETGRKRAKETSAPAMAAGFVVLGGQSDPMAAAIATSAIAGSAAGPNAAIEHKQTADSSLNALTQDSSDVSSSATIVRQNGPTHRAFEPVSHAAMTVTSAGAKPGSVVGTPSQDGIVEMDPRPDAPGPGAEANSADERVLSAQHAAGTASDASLGPGPTDIKDDRQSGITAPASPSAANGVDQSRQAAQSPAGADSVQAPALAAAAANPSREQVAPARDHKLSQISASAVHAAGAPSFSAADASQVARNSAGASAAGQALNRASAAAGVASRGPDARETFAALDAEPGAGAPSWIHAGPQQAEAGFQDPALGWVGVRADLGAGGIHAAILPGSDEAASLLGGHLAGLNAHLAAEQIPVDSLRVVTQTGSGSSGADYGGMPSGQQGTAYQGQGQSPEQGATSLSGVGAQSQRQSVFENGGDSFGADQAGHMPVEQMLPASARYISVVA